MQVADQTEKNPGRDTKTGFDIAVVVAFGNRTVKLVNSWSVG